MLQSLHVKNLALIKEVEVEFEPGLNILTGETGAGKSIVLGSIGLALGGRYHADILRKDAEHGFVELVFSVKEEAQISKLKEMEIFPEDGMVIISRKFMESRSVSKINGETVQVAQLKEAAAVLIDIHGQHEHQSLLYKKNHLAILDAFAKSEVSKLKSAVREAYKEYQSCRRKLQEEGIDEAERSKEQALLEFEISEIKGADLKPDEDMELEELYRKMTGGKKIVESIQEAYGYTSENPGINASDALSRAIRALQDITMYDETAEELLNQLAEVDSLLNDFNRSLSVYGKGFEFSPEEFYETENRLNEINHLKTKYGNSVEDILAYLAEKEERLTILSDYDLYLNNLKEACLKAEEVLAEASAALSRIRTKKAAQLSQVIKEGLLDLNFAEVRFHIAVTKMNDYSENGVDEVEFLISMNPGEAEKPLASVASGGELSRIMLAIKTVLADKDEIETLIFDEIDVGISGRTAQKVSEKMAILAKRHQVICITHLPQIAAMADAHFAIEKAVKNQTTTTEINLLNEEESVQELARILGGAEITEATVEHARQMKQLALRSK